MSSAADRPDSRSRWRNAMPVLTLIVYLLIFALVWWLFSTYILPHVVEPFRTIIIVVLVLAVIVWLLSLIGVVGPLRLQ